MPLPRVAMRLVAGSWRLNHFAIFLFSFEFRIPLPPETMIVSSGGASLKSSRGVMTTPHSVTHGAPPMPRVNGW
jgi:hypothetical protein